MAKKSIGSRIANTIFTIILLVVLYKVYGIYKEYNFGSFTKAEYNQGVTKFSRDNKTTYTYNYSYKLESKGFNDAMFYKEITVKPNTSYKLSCMVKTENVESENASSNGGAQISILNTTEASEIITGTNEWQKLEFIFDSKNRDKLEIGFRLGGNAENAKGTVWFSDFKLEEGLKDNSSNWNVACFIIKNIDVQIDNQNLKLSMSVSDTETIKSNMERFKNSARDLSSGRMTVDYDIYEIDTPVTRVTYSNEFGYYLDPLDVKDLLKEYLDIEEYDYIFVAVRMGDMDKNIEIPVYDWIGLRRNGLIWNRIFKYKASK